MIRMLYAIIMIFAFASCSSDSEIREEVIERHSEGQKKTVVRYQGQGVNEELIAKFEYDETGDLILKEDLINKIKLNWGQLQPELKTAKGLKNYLQGDWVSEEIENPGEYTEKFIKILLNVNGDIATFLYEHKYKFLRIPNFEKRDINILDYKPNFSVAMTSSKGGHPIDLTIKIKSKASFTMSSDYQENAGITFNKTDTPMASEYLPRSYTKMGHGGALLADDALHVDDGGPWIMNRDNDTGLIWEVKTNANKDDKYNWSNAHDIFIADLNSGGFGGFSDWRMPTVNELSSLVNKGNLNPAIDTAFFPKTVSSMYWSSTVARDTDLAKFVNFNEGEVGNLYKPNSYYVRAVRAGQ